MKWCVISHFCGEEVRSPYSLKSLLPLLKYVSTCESVFRAGTILVTCATWSFQFVSLEDTHCVSDSFFLRLCVMDEITKKVRELQVAKDVDLIPSLVEKMAKSSYISSTTRSRVVNILLHSNKRSPDVMMRLADIFRQSARCYISRSDVRNAITILKEIQSDQTPTAFQNTGNWVKEQWFGYLVDSGSIIIKPLITILNKLKVCRRSVSSFTILLFGETEEVQFFTALREEFNAIEPLRNMTDDIMKKLFKYYGGITIDGSLDCEHVMAGNCFENMLVRLELLEVSSNLVLK